MKQPMGETIYPVRLGGVLLYRVWAFEAWSGLRHAIFTRQGGVSRAPYASLNVGSTVGDEPEAVKENLRRVCAALDIGPEQVATCYQVHGAEVLTVGAGRRAAVLGSADGLVTAETGVYLFLRFADCTPLLFFDPVRRAVGLAHAGWRGTMKNVAGATVETMVKGLGCKAEDMVAVVGPAIGPCCYEVGPEVMMAAAAHFADPADLFRRRNGTEERAYFDMAAANRRQLAEQGVGQIISTEICTACQTERFFSHRAEAGRTGRFGVMIGLSGAAG